MGRKDINFDQIPRGEGFPNGIHFTSYRMDCKLASKIATIAEKHGISPQVAVTRLLEFSVENIKGYNFKDSEITVKVKPTANQIKEKPAKKVKVAKEEAPAKKKLKKKVAKEETPAPKTGKKTLKKKGVKAKKEEPELELDDGGGDEDQEAVPEND